MMPQPSGGPFVKTALLCEYVLTERDNVKSLIRIVDRVIQSAIGPLAPSEPSPFRYELYFVVMLVSGRAQGRADFTVVVEPPSGIEAKTMGSGTLHWEGGHKGVDVVMKLNVQFEHEGVYWFTFNVDGHELARTPCEVRFQRITPGPAGLAG